MVEAIISSQSGVLQILFYSFTFKLNCDYISKISEVQEEIFYSLKAHPKISLKNNLTQRKKNLKRKRKKQSPKQNCFHFSLGKFYSEAQVAFPEDSYQPLILKIYVIDLEKP